MGAALCDTMLDFWDPDQSKVEAVYKELLLLYPGLYVCVCVSIRSCCCCNQGTVHKELLLNKKLLLDKKLLLCV